MDSLETINLTMTELVEKEINQIVEDNPVKSPTELDMVLLLMKTQRMYYIYYLQTMLKCFQPKMMTSNIQLPS